MGEVLTPGQIEVHDERISIFDALGAAGDLTIYGDRRHVNVIRENNGKKSLQQLDLTQSSIFTSPYYYLQQNDVVYVEPNKTRKKDSRIGSNDNFALSVYSISLTTISLLVTLYNVFLK
jgi:polysaccharide export outer membrane protein